MPWAALLHRRPTDRAIRLLRHVAQNDGEAGHQTRHFLVLEELCVVLRSVWGGAVQREPQNYHNYSDTRPDVAAACVGEGGSMFVGDVKLFDAIGSGGVPHGRGAYVAFGNTRPRARALVLGLLRRGKAGDGAWDWARGQGYVEGKAGAYARAIEAGCTVVPLLFETFGGFSPEVAGLLKSLGEARQNRLNTGEFDLSSWSSRTWMSYATQRLSVAVHMAAAGEIIQALGLAAAGDPRGA